MIGKAAFTSIKAWGQKVGPKVWSATKEAPGKVKKYTTDKFSKLMYSYPFRVPSRFALIIRAVVSQEGLALRLDPEFKILNIAYPYIAKKLLTDNSEEILDILLEVVFDKKGQIQIEKVESLLNILFNCF